MTRVDFVVNPNAANGRCGKLWPAVEAVAQRIFPEVKSWHTCTSGDGIPLARQAVEDGAVLVVSVGGDGTHNEVINGLMQLKERPRFAILSVGTGGDFRKTVGWPLDPVAAVQALLLGQARPIDLGQMSYVDHEGQEAQRYFGNIASFGIGGLVDDMVNRTTKIFGGKASFLAGTLRATLAYRNQPVVVCADGKEVYNGPVYNVAVCNGKYFGGGMMVGPGAELSDGLFDLVIMGDLSFVQTVSMASTIYSGSHISRPGIQSFRCRSVEVTTESEKVMIDLDGEFPGHMPGRFEIVPEALHMVFPEDS